MLSCSVHQVGIAVHDDWLFRDISFDIQAIDRIAIVGPNGSGKTTLVRLLAGRERPDEGQIAVKKEVSVGYLEQMHSFPESFSVREVLESAFEQVQEQEKKLRDLEHKMATATKEADLNRLLAQYASVQEQFEKLGGYQVESKISAVADGLGITERQLSMPFVEQSGGEQTKVSLGRLLLGHHELLLLDEPTNHLDFAALEWLESYLQNYKGAVVVVSHDRYFLDSIATKVLELDGGKLQTYHGGYSAAMAERERRLLAEFQAYQEQQKKLTQMAKAIQRLRDWANRSKPPSAAMHRRATNMERAMDRIQKLDKPIIERRKMALEFEAGDRSGKDVIRTEGVGKIFGDKLVLLDASLHVRYGEHVALVGSNGSGKSTLIKLMMGDLEPDGGDIRLGPSVRIGYLSQQGLEGQETLTVLDAFRSEVPVTEEVARRKLAKFLFYGEDVFKKCQSLSGGEQMRLRLAQLMQQDINLLILDEPTNHLDIDSREVLEDAIENFAGTVFAVSHDRHFMNRLFERTLWLEDGCITSYLGNYDMAKTRRNE